MLNYSITKLRLNLQRLENNKLINLVECRDEQCYKTNHACTHSPLLLT